MATSQNINEAGWFYHAPRKNVAQDQVYPPPPSQVPGLSAYEMPTEGEPAPKPLFRDTDTKYIRLAKQGGRQDLLQMRNKDYRSKEPVGYPRCEWFAPPRQRTPEEEQKYVSLVPEYMVHDPYKPYGDKQMSSAGSVRSKRAPFAFDNKSVYERDDDLTANDKTVKLPELRKQGYGVRSGKPLHFKKNPPPERPKGPNGQLESTKSGQKSKSTQQEQKNERVTMQRILGNTYGNEWVASQEDWHAKQESHNEKKKLKAKEPPLKSEYEDAYSISKEEKDKKKKSKSPRKSGDGDGDGYGTNRSRGGSNKNEKEEKELFKMARFKNIPARIHSHMPPEILAAAQ